MSKTFIDYGTMKARPTRRCAPCQRGQTPGEWCTCPPLYAFIWPRKPKWPFKKSGSLVTLVLALALLGCPTGTTTGPVYVDDGWGTRRVQVRQPDGLGRTGRVSVDQRPVWTQYPRDAGWIDVLGDTQ